MKKILFVVTIMFVIAACNKESISEQSIVSVIKKDGMIAEAEQKLGSLYKEKITFTDPSSGSKFNFVFAALDKESLARFFKENDVMVKGVSLEEKENILRETKKMPNSENIASSNSNSSDGFYESEVYYDLISKELNGNAVGFSFGIMPKNSKVSENSKSLRPNYSWRQQTSLPWCEVAKITPVNESPVTYHYLYFQVRGLFWNGSGSPFWNMPTNGIPEYMGIDGPKFTRYGGENSTYDKFHVIWYDLESGETRED
jgi:hypothetical protein